MSDLYDVDGNYLLLFEWDRRLDPAWPGQTPEPMTPVWLGRGLPVVPVALTFARDHRPQHIRMIREMLRRLPERRLTRVVGHGNATGSWMAVNEGPDGEGSWLIDRELPASYRGGSVWSDLLKGARRLAARVPFVG